MARIVNIQRKSRRHSEFFYDKRENKAILYFSASSTSMFQQLYDFGIRESLASYYYIKKSLAYWDKMLPKFKSEGGIFMTDSGAFSFLSKYQQGTKEWEQVKEESFWLPYLEEYVAWIRSHKDYIFSAANLDIDAIVGEDVVNKWNKRYFEPLEKEGIQIIYVAHDTDKSKFMQRFEYYCKNYEYVGANQMLKKQAPQIFQMVKRYNRRVHGFAWTQFDLLKHYPFFSVDSVTWLGGVRFGTTYDYDGKNFRTIDFKHKYVRKSRKVKYLEADLNWENIQEEKRDDINRMNLLGWMGFRKEYMKMANLKLHTKTVNYYERH